MEPVKIYFDELEKPHKHHQKLMVISFGLVILSFVVNKDALSSFFLAFGGGGLSIFIIFMLYRLFYRRPQEIGTRMVLFYDKNLSIRPVPFHKWIDLPATCIKSIDLTKKTPKLLFTPTTNIKDLKFASMTYKSKTDLARELVKFARRNGIDLNK